MSQTSLKNSYEDERRGLSTPGRKAGYKCDALMHTVASGQHVVILQVTSTIVASMFEYDLPGI